MVPVLGDTPAASAAGARGLSSAIVVRSNDSWKGQRGGAEGGGRGIPNVVGEGSNRVTHVSEAYRSIDGYMALLWPHGSDPDARDEGGMTALALAAKHGMGRMAESLLAAGAAVDAEDEEGYTPLCWVSSNM